LLSVSKKEYELGLKKSDKIGTYLRNNLDKESIVLGPTMASMFKINNIYHYQIIIKYKKDINIINTLKFIDNMYKQDTKIKVEVDFNPIRI